MRGIRLMFFVSFVFVYTIGLTNCQQSPVEPIGSDQLSEPQYLAKSSYVDGAAFDTTGRFEETTGAQFIIHIPAGWNGELVLFAHGYVSVFEPGPLQIPERQLYLADKTSIPEFFTSMQYAFAATSYRSNGLVSPEVAIADIFDVLSLFQDVIGGYPEETYLFGVSEGGLYTTLAVEQYPNMFSGGLATCAPIGDFQQQVNYLADFRVLFDYFFGGVLPKWTADDPLIPGEVQFNFAAKYVPAILDTLAKDPVNLQKLLAVSKAAYVPGVPQTAVKTVIDLLQWSVFAYNDAYQKLGGNPFDNYGKQYSGSGSLQEDIALNKAVERFHIAPDARHRIKREFETAGMLDIPLVTLHTTLDPVVPYWNMPLNEFKTRRGNSEKYYKNFAVEMYGHCTFGSDALSNAFEHMILMVEQQDMYANGNIDQMMSTSIR